MGNFKCIIIRLNMLVGNFKCIIIRLRIPVDYFKCIIIRLNISWWAAWKCNYIWLNTLSATSASIEVDLPCSLSMISWFHLDHNSKKKKNPHSTLVLLFCFCFTHLVLSSCDQGWFLFLHAWRRSCTKWGDGSVGRVSDYIPWPELEPHQEKEKN